MQSSGSQRKLVETSPPSELLCRLSPQGSLSSISAQLTQWSGWEETEWLGKPFHTFLHPDDVAQIQVGYSELLQGESITFPSVRLRTRAGHELSCALSFVPRLTHQKVVEILVIGSCAQRSFRGWSPDKNSLVRNERRNRPTEPVPEIALLGLLETLLASAPVGFALFDSELRFICLNPSFASLTGFAPEQLLGEPVTRRIPSLRAAEPQLRRVLDHGEVILDCELKLREFVFREQSSCARFSFYPLRDGTGRVFGIAAIAQDITSQKRAVAQLHESEERLRLAVEAASLGTWDLDLQTSEIVLSPRTKELFGFSNPESWSDDSFLELIHPDDRNRVEAAVKQAKEPKNGGDYRIEFRSVGGDAHRERWLSSQGKVSFDENLRPLRFIGTVMDISSRKSYELMRDRLTEELGRSNEALEEFAYVVSHDLKEPLRMVSSFMRLLKSRYAEKIGGVGEEFITFALEGSQRATRLIDDVLEYSKLGKVRLREESIDTSQLLSRILATLEPAIHEARAKIHGERLPTVFADEAGLSSVFRNLIDNALRYRGPDAPAVTIAASETASAWIFSVQDNGAGIDPKFHEAIFSPLRRLHAPNRSGSGLGLPICKKIIERHGGKIWLTSAEGAGCTFYFSLPRARP